MGFSFHETYCTAVHSLVYVTYLFFPIEIPLAQTSSYRFIREERVEEKEAIFEGAKRTFNVSYKELTKTNSLYHLIVSSNPCFMVTKGWYRRSWRVLSIFTTRLRILSMSLRSM